MLSSDIGTIGFVLIIEDVLNDPAFEPAAIKSGVRHRDSLCVVFE